VESSVLIIFYRFLILLAGSFSVFLLTSVMLIHSLRDVADHSFLLQPAFLPGLVGDCLSLNFPNAPVEFLLGKK